MNPLEGNQTIDAQAIREKYIEILSSSPVKSDKAKEISEQLFSCGLTMYSDSFSFDSIFYKSFAQSVLNKDISLHPEQLKVIKSIKDNSALIISAPTSFGKTFCIFEYIARYKPKNVVLVVPTLALSREYQNTIMQYGKSLFNYNVYTSIEEKNEYDFANCNNLFILTHERAVANSAYNKIESIDFLVIDEVYKLDSKIKDDRTLVLNVSLYYLIGKASKYCLLAPYIGDVINKDKLAKSPKMVYLNYSPVLNKVHQEIVFDDCDRFGKTINLLHLLGDKKTMIYIPSPSEIAKFIDQHLASLDNIYIQSNELEDFLDWARDEIHPSWSVVKALEKGFVVHHGAMPLGIRDYLLSVFDDKQSGINKLICTSTLLEGVNVNAECLIITKASKNSMSQRAQLFNSFEFYNLVGRTGRLFKYFVGNCYYIRTNSEPSFEDKTQSKVNIEFELTKSEEDIDIQINDGKNSPEAAEYLKNIGIQIDEYNKIIGAPMRLETFKSIRKKYEENKDELFGYLSSKNKWNAIRLISKMCKLKTDRYFDYQILFTVLTNPNEKTKNIVDKLLQNDYLTVTKGMKTEDLIESVLRIRNGYLEHNLLSRSKVIELFLQMDDVSETDLEFVRSSISAPIELMYALNSPERKILRSIGVYETDINSIIERIGTSFFDLTSLKQLIKEHYDELAGNIGFISRFEIQQFIKEKK